MTTNRQTAPPSDRQRLELRVRCVLLDDGSVSRHASVYCPVREHSVRIDECSQCERWRGLEAGKPHSVVVCDAPAPSPEPLELTQAAVGDIVSRTVTCVQPTTALSSLVALLVEQGLSAVPVVDPAGRPIGVASKTDLVQNSYERGGTFESEAPPAGLGQGFHVEPSQGTVAEIMTPVALWVHERSSIAQAAALMAYEGVHQLPVVSDDHEVVGLVSSLDLLRWIGQRTGYLIPGPDAPSHPVPRL